MLSPANVVPFRPSAPAEPKVPPTLSPVERRAFRELAQELTSRLRGPEAPAAETGVEEAPAEAVEAGSRRRGGAHHRAGTARSHSDRRPGLSPRQDALRQSSFPRMERLRQPCRNRGSRRFDHAVRRTRRGRACRSDDAPPLASLSIVTQRGETVPVQGRMFTVPWSGSSALALILTNGQAAAVQQEAERTLGIVQRENRELKSTLDIATDGVVTLDAEGRAVSANARAMSLFGKAADEFSGCSLRRPADARKRTCGARLFRPSATRRRR